MSDGTSGECTVSESASVQRVRITFSKGEAVKYISHLSVMRAWERIVRRADLPIAYSHGFNPRPKLAFASALSVGYMGRAEILDLELRECMPVGDLLGRVRPQLPDGFAVHSVVEIPLRVPSAQSKLRYSVYHVSFLTDQTAGSLQEKLDRLLSASELPRRRVVKGKTREYDLRPLIHKLWYIGSQDATHVIGMRLANSSVGAGRVDEVAEELGLLSEMRSVERIELIFSDLT
jgi:radical SAM-linked protein